MIELSEETLIQLQEQFEKSHPGEVLEWAAEHYRDRLAVVTSFQPTGIVTLHMLSEIAPNTPVITLDTGFLFPETHNVIDEMENRFRLNLHRVKPQLTVPQQTVKYGGALWESDPNLCCRLRKSLPLEKALTGYEAWIAGLRRDQSPTRANTPIVKWDEKRGMMKLSPFATWTEEMVWTYIDMYDLPYNQLHDVGYPSIGCYHCTQPAQDLDDTRSGRWTKHAKTECGIHFDNA